MNSQAIKKVEKMEIRIDTTKDSKEDIRKAIRLLQSLADESADATGMGSGGQSFPSGENVLGGFFDAADTPPQISANIQQTAAVTSSDMPQASALPDKTEDKKEIKSRKFSIGSSGGFDVY